MQVIKEIIPGIIQGLKVKRKKAGPASTPQAVLKKILGKRELKHAKFAYWKNNVFGITVDSSVWLYQLNLGKEELCKKLQQELPQAKELRFRLGSLREK